MEVTNGNTEHNVEVLKSSEFLLEAAKHRLTTLCLPGTATEATPRERLQHLASLIDFEAIAMVRAAGALVAYLQRRSVIGDFSDAACSIKQVNVYV